MWDEELGLKPGIVVLRREHQLEIWGVGVRIVSSPHAKNLQLRGCVVTAALGQDRAEPINPQKALRGGYQRLVL